MDDADSDASASSADPGGEPDSVDASARPEWWQEAIEEFRAHGLRPFEPPRFSDGTLAFRAVERLEAELGVDVDFAGIRVAHGDDWVVRVDGDVVDTVGRRRTSDAYTEYEMESEEFEELVRGHVEDD